MILEESRGAAPRWGSSAPLGLAENGFSTRWDARQLQAAYAAIPGSFAHTSRFSTKNRERIITARVRDALHACMARVMQNHKCPATLINSVEDHMHILFELARTGSVSDLVEEVKKASSKWMKSQGAEYGNFAWQAGYGAFAVSESNVPMVREYIVDQREHHRTKSFQEEYRGFLERHGIAFDERYVWD